MQKKKKKNERVWGRKIIAALISKFGIRL
jgi:hypothetical protein